MIKRKKTFPLIYGFLCCLFLLGTSPCVLCPSIADAAEQETHDCCREGTPKEKNKSNTDKSHEDNSCCVISGFCEVAIHPVIHDSSPEKILTELPPVFGDHHENTFIAFAAPHHLINPPHTSLPDVSISSTIRLALLQRFLI